MTDPEPILTVLFDGTCGFCTRSARWLRRLDRHGRIETIPCQLAKDDPRLGLAGVDCGREAWAVASDGRRGGGSQAFTLIAAVLLGRSWPVTVGRWPVIRQILDLGYRLIATNRHRFPGDPPPLNGDCGSIDGTMCRR